MINLVQKGLYKLIGTVDKKKMLYLDGTGYLWANAKGIGELLTLSKEPHRQESLMAEGEYRIYKVKDEPHLVDLLHLELSIGKGKWQGYLLLTGLPTKNRIRRRIVPTSEVISKMKIKML